MRKGWDRAKPVLFVLLCLAGKGNLFLNWVIILQLFLLIKVPASYFMPLSYSIKWIMHKTISLAMHMGLLSEPITAAGSHNYCTLLKKNLNPRNCNAWSSLLLSARTTAIQICVWIKSHKCYGCLLFLHFSKGCRFCIKLNISIFQVTLKKTRHNSHW